MRKRYFKLLLAIMLVVAGLGVSPTPFARSQDGSTVTVSLTPYENNPIVEKGPADAWDGLNI